MPQSFHLRNPWLALALLSGASLGRLWLSDPRVGKLWLRSAELAAAACAFAVPLGTLLAVLLFKTNAPGRTATLPIFVALLFLPLYLVTGAWDAGFGIQGWHTLVSNPNLSHEPWLVGWRAAAWVHGIAAVPWVVLIVGAGLRGVEAELEEDAATCASPWQVLWHISLRRALPAMAVAALWVSTMVLTEISVTDFFQVRTFAEEVYTQSALGTLEPGGGGQGVPLSNAQSTGNERSTLNQSAAGLWSGLAVATLVAVGLIAGLARLFADWADASHRPPWLWRMHGSRWGAGALLFAGLLLVVGVPLFNLAYKAGIEVTTSPTGRLRAWSLVKLASQVAKAPIEFRGELAVSGLIGTAAASAAVLIALPIAWRLRRAMGFCSCGKSLAKDSARRPTPSGPTSTGPTPIQMLVLVAIAWGMTIPGPLVGLGLIHLFNRPPDSFFAPLATLYDSNFTPWLAQTLRATPIAILILWPALASVPQSLLDAAAADGAPPWRRLLRIALPQRWHAIAAAWLIALAVAIGELAATILVMPPQTGASALSIRIFQLLHFGVDDRVAAICLAMTALLATLTGIANWLMQRKVNDEWRMTEEERR